MSERRINYEKKIKIWYYSHRVADEKGLLKQEKDIIHFFSIVGITTGF